MTASWAMCVSTRCVLWDAEQTLTAPSPILVSTIAALIRAEAIPVDLMPSAKWWTTGPNAPAPSVSSPTQLQLLGVSSSPRHVHLIPNAQSDKSAMESSARMFALMTRPVLLMRSVTMVSVSPSVAAMMTVTAKRSARA